MALEFRLRSEGRGEGCKVWRGGKMVEDLIQMTESSIVPAFGEQGEVRDSRPDHPHLSLMLLFVPKLNWIELVLIV